ncbi:hypothetical protein Tco_1066234 [Tanacetum coccineum]|uniref:Uncharacterized protein n=1 Tax=Tanacetum coccineum TaxID=301880 RepID=A0ABQ5HBA3_9ASTR
MVAVAVGVACRGGDGDDVVTGWCGGDANSGGWSEGTSGGKTSLSDDSGSVRLEKGGWTQSVCHSTFEGVRTWDGSVLRSVGGARKKSVSEYVLYGYIK